jgi:LysR family transcriptional activator of nhaA
MAPMLLPDPDSKMRQLLEDYFHKQHIHPHVIAEISDSALLKSFGQSGVGLFPVPSIAVPQVVKQYQVVDFGPLEGITEHIYASYSASKQNNPAVDAILTRAHEVLLH